ncbi:hypothetical protein GQR36_16755 [Enterococcus termitis]
MDAFLLKEQQLIYQNDTIAGTGAVLFGGFAFDYKSSAQNDWGEMEQGLFYLPTFLITQKKNNSILLLVSVLKLWMYYSSDGLN